MKVYSFFLSFLLIFLPHSRAMAASASCSSSQCSTSVDCRGTPAWAVCEATCSSGCRERTSTEPPSLAPLVGLEPRLLSLNVESIQDSALGDLLSEQLQTRVLFFSTESLSIDAKNMPADELMGALSHHGALFIRHTPPTEVVLEQRYSLLARGIGPELLSSALSQVLNRSISFRSYSSTPLSIEIKNLPLGQILKSLSTHGILEFPEPAAY